MRSGRSGLKAFKKSASPGPEGMKRGIPRDFASWASGSSSIRGSGFVTSATTFIPRASIASRERKPSRYMPNRRILVMRHPAPSRADARLARAARRGPFPSRSRSRIVRDDLLKQLIEMPLGKLLSVEIQLFRQTPALHLEPVPLEPARRLEGPHGHLKALGPGLFQPQEPGVLKGEDVLPGAKGRAHHNPEANPERDHGGHPRRDEGPDARAPPSRRAGVLVPRPGHAAREALGRRFRRRLQGQEIVRSHLVSLARGGPVSGAAVHSDPEPRAEKRQIPDERHGLEGRPVEPDERHPQGGAAPDQIPRRTGPGRSNHVESRVKQKVAQGAAGTLLFVDEEDFGPGAVRERAPRTAPGGVVALEDHQGFAEIVVRHVPCEPHGRTMLRRLEGEDEGGVQNIPRSGTQMTSPGSTARSRSSRPSRTASRSTTTCRAPPFSVRRSTWMFPVEANFV